MATVGTALTVEHLNSLAQITDKITLAFDGDEAGLQATERASDLNRVHLGIRFHVATLPARHDPAYLLANSRKHSFEAAIANAVPLEHHSIDQIVDSHNLEEPEAIVRAIRAARSVLHSTADTDVRAESTEYLAKRLGRDVVLVAEYLRQTRQPRAHERSRSNGKSTGRTRTFKRAKALVWAWLLARNCRFHPAWELFSHQLSATEEKGAGRPNA